MASLTENNKGFTDGGGGGARASATVAPLSKNNKGFTDGGGSGTRALATVASLTENNKGFAGGDGSEARPFLVATAEQLDNVRNYSYRYYEEDGIALFLPGNCFKLIADIDLTEYLSEGGGGYNGGKGWAPIDIANCVFDGGGFTVSGLWCDRTRYKDDAAEENEKEYIGLFGYASDVIIKNVNLVLSDKGIKGYDYCGGIVGMLTTYSSNKASALISGCSVTGNVTSTKTKEEAGAYSKAAKAGMIAGFVNYAAIAGCIAKGTVTGLTAVGGIAGDVQFANISDCYFDGRIVPTAPAEWETACAGGIAGVSFGGDTILRNCFYSGVSDSDGRVAAIAGFNGWLSGVDSEGFPMEPPSVYGCYYNADVFKNPLTFFQPCIDVANWLEDCGDAACDHIYCDGTYFYIEADIQNSLGLTAVEMRDKASFAGWNFESVWGYDKSGNIVLRAFGGAYDYQPPDLTWLRITLACALFAAAVFAGAILLYRRKKSEVVTVTNTVEVVKEVPVVKKLLPADLSEQERRVAESMLQGLSRREIALKLEVSEGAVKSYMTRIYIKAAVSGQKEFITRYLVEG